MDQSVALFELTCLLCARTFYLCRSDYHGQEYCGDACRRAAEAANRDALSRGMQGLTIRVARRINKTLGRRGKVFVDRYFETVVKSLKQARNCLCYVLLNAQRHAAQSGMRCEPGWIDPCSSGRYFDGWRGLRVRPPPDEEPCRPSGMASSSGTSRDELGSPSALAGPALEEPTVSEPHTWILSTGWRRYGLIPLDALPGRRRGSR